MRRCRLRISPYNQGSIRHLFIVAYSPLSFSRDSAQKQSKTLGTLCPWRGQPVPRTWSLDAQYMVSKCPCNGHQETLPMDLI